MLKILSLLLRKLKAPKNNILFSCLNSVKRKDEDWHIGIKRLVLLLTITEMKDLVFVWQQWGSNIEPRSKQLVIHPQPRHLNNRFFNLPLITKTRMLESCRHPAPKRRLRDKEVTYVWLHSENLQSESSYYLSGNWWSPRPENVEEISSLSKPEEWLHICPQHTDLRILLFYL